jgi:acyl transferase domain-containing protein
MTDQRTAADSNAVAVIGLACRLPMASNPMEFWRLLRDGVNTITEVPQDRWDIEATFGPLLSLIEKNRVRWGGFLDRVDHFDADFFGISPREANEMDPR